MYDKTGNGTAADGFLTSSNISAGSSSQSQTISVSKTDGKALTYGTI